MPCSKRRIHVSNSSMQIQLQQSPERTRQRTHYSRSSSIDLEDGRMRCSTLPDCALEPDGPLLLFPGTTGTRQDMEKQGGPVADGNQPLRPELIITRLPVKDLESDWWHGILNSSASLERHILKQDTLPVPGLDNIPSTAPRRQVVRIVFAVSQTCWTAGVMGMHTCCTSGEFVRVAHQCLPAVMDYPSCTF